MTPRIPHAWPGGEYPYDVFEGTRITPQIPHTELLDASLELQGEDQLTTKARPAFDLLRTVDSRLAIDFFLYNPEFADPKGTLVRVIQEAAEGRSNHE